MLANFLSELQQLEIGDLKGNLFKVEKGFPKQDQYKSFRVANTIPYFIRLNNKNVIIFQIIDLGIGCSVISDYNFHQPMELYCNIHSKVLELFTTLYGSIYFHVEHDKTRAAHSGYFNLIAAPAISNRATVPAGKIRTLDTHIDPSYLDSLCPTNPVLRKIIEANNSGNRAALHEDNGQMTLHSAVLAYQFINAVDKKNPIIAEKKKLFEQWFKSLLNPTGITMAASKFTHEKIESIAHLLDHINEYMDTNFKIADLISESAKIHQLTQNDINRGIQLIFGKTAAKYIKDCKMLEAKRLLDHGKSESEVANLVGYGHLTHFVRDFKLYFKISLKEYKAQLKKNIPK
jgi:AraC-like DNA-binding protein